MWPIISYTINNKKITTFVRILCASCSNFPFSWNLKCRLPLAEPLLLWQRTTYIKESGFDHMLHWNCNVLIYMNTPGPTKITNWHKPPSHLKVSLKFFPQQYFLNYTTVHSIHTLSSHVSYADWCLNNFRNILLHAIIQVIYRNTCTGTYDRRQPKTGQCTPMGHTYIHYLRLSSIRTNNTKIEARLAKSAANQ